MPALVAGIHAFLCFYKDVDGRDKPGHDVDRVMPETYYGLMFASLTIFW